MELKAKIQAFKFTIPSDFEISYFPEATERMKQYLRTGSLEPFMLNAEGMNYMVAGELIIRFLDNLQQGFLNQTGVLRVTGMADRLTHIFVHDDAFSTLRSENYRELQDAIREKISSNSKITQELVHRFTTSFQVNDAIACLEQNRNYKKYIRNAISTWEKRNILTQNILNAIPERIIDYYPLARALKRHFILHIGPTNSGKTYTAIEEMKQAESGMYLAPLRLLAYEQYDRMNRDNCPCTLITGEEKIRIDGAEHVSSTVEMADLADYYSVVVIDEAQMISDRDRGGSWTAAILGVVSTRIHICMAPCALNLIIRLINLCGDTYEIVKHERQVPLELEPEPVSFPKCVQDKDAYIVFSKRDVHAVANELMRKGIKCSMVYGDLPHDVRENEAHRFSTGETSVVVATDAIGTGLNLPIRRIVFLKGDKFDGVAKRELSPIEVQQISGRAGRFGMFDIGYVNATYDAYDIIKDRLYTEPEDLKIAVIRFPENLISIPSNLSDILVRWNEISTDEGFQKATILEEIKLCKILENYTEDKKLIYNFITIPFDSDNEILYDLWMNLFKDEISNKEFKYTEYLNPLSRIDIARKDLKSLENIYRELDLLYYYMDRFAHDDGKDQVSALRYNVSTKIMKLLSEQKIPEKVCKNCGRPLPWYYSYGICEKCHSGSFRRR